MNPRVPSALLVAALLLLLLPGASPAQETRDDAAPGPTRAAAASLQQAEGAEDRRTSPLGAFARNMVLPGWGHAKVGAYGRGGFYFLSDAAIGWMLFKTVSFLESAREQEEVVVEAARRRLRGEGITDPDSLAAALEEDEAVVQARDLVSARVQQREDWIALGVFFLLLGGADAFVSAHLSDFPQPLGLGPGPGGSVEVKASIPVGPPEPDRGRR